MFRKEAFASLAAAVFMIGGLSAEEPFRSSPAEREALFDHLLDTVLRREAFSPYKDTHFGTDIVADLRARRGEFIAAETGEQLYYALVRFSNTRRDRHLSVGTVASGVAPDDVDELHAPLRFAVDFSEPGSYSLFVADVSPKQLPAGVPVKPGELVISINGRTPADHVKLFAPYLRHSTWNGLWYHIARTLPERSALLPPELRGEKLDLVLAGADGSRRSISLPYHDPDELEWMEYDLIHHPDFKAVYETSTYSLFRHPERRAFLLQWHGFEDDLRRDMDRLVKWAEKKGALDHDLIIDATRSGGGSQGAYALQRLSPKPFKATFGNLRISDVTADFVDAMRNDLRPSRKEEKWLLDWLADDVTKGIADGQAYTNNVPFKLAHAPKWSDGLLLPADLHFKGRLVLLLGPHGGSHLDQFAAMIKDNGLGHIIGLPAGGFSNTWEWEEVLTLPGSNHPVANFMWNIGHTVRPNGQILESNPAVPDDLFPPSRAHHDRYHALLLERAYAWLDEAAEKK